MRAVVGLALVPHGLRMTFGFFGNTGQPLRNIGMLADYLDRQGYRPGKVWAAAISVTQLVGGPLLALGLFTRLVAVPIVLFLLVSNIERWRVGKYFWNQLGLEYTLMWTVAALYLSRARRRRLFARPARHRLGILTLKRITRRAANLRPSAQWARVGDARARHSPIDQSQ